MILLVSFKARLCFDRVDLLEIHRGLHCICCVESYSLQLLLFILDVFISKEDAQTCFAAASSSRRDALL